jgi:hypothetical protein
MIKRYNQFIKENINEDIDAEEINSFDDQELDDQELDQDLTQDDFDEDYEDDDLEEEEAADLYKTKLSELASLLGVEVVDGKVEYNGKQIIFPSETEMYHVGNKKFKTAEEVVEFLNAGSEAPKEEMSDEEEGDFDKNIDMEGDFSLENEDEFGMDEEELESKSYKNKNLRRW